METVKPPRIIPPYIMSPQWYILWAPMGFGGTVDRVKEIQLAVHVFDPEGVVWYPLYPEVVDGKTMMRAVYPGYMFVHAKWSESIEVLIQERIPVFSTFLKDEDLIPFYVATDVMEGVKEAVNQFLHEPEKPMEVHGLKIGDSIKIIRRVFAGQVGKVVRFDLKGKVIVELSMFGGREVEMSYEAKDLQRL